MALSMKLELLHDSLSIRQRDQSICVLRVGKGHPSGSLTLKGYVVMLGFTGSTLHFNISGAHCSVSQFDDSLIFTCGSLEIQKNAFEIKLA